MDRRHEVIRRRSRLGIVLVLGLFRTEGSLLAESGSTPVFTPGPEVMSAAEKARSS